MNDYFYYSPRLTHDELCLLFDIAADANKYKAFALGAFMTLVVSDEMERRKQPMEEPPKEFNRRVDSSAVGKCDQCSECEEEHHKYAKQHPKEQTPDLHPSKHCAAKERAEDCAHKYRQNAQQQCLGEERRQ